MSRLTHLLALLLALALIAPPTAHAQTEAQLQARLEALKAETARAGAAYSKAHWALDETDVELARTNKRIAATRAELKEARARLNAHAAAVYRRESLDLFGFLMGASSFAEFAARADLLGRVGESDADAVGDVERLSAKLSKQRQRLTEERSVRAKKARAFDKRRDRLQEQLRQRSAEFVALKRQLDRARGGGGSTFTPGPNGMVFPVVGSYYYADTWGASRSGGRRRHQGTDIMAPRGTRCVAVLSGTVRTKTGGLGGKTTWLTADNGWQFYYAHLDSWTVRSGRVRAGQVIGTVGSTGNASGGAPHLHFQIHPGGGSPVNPYPYLRGME